MSLKDTIRGAREEASANVSSLNRGRDAKSQAPSTENKTKSTQGFARRSAASGRPAREAAAGVRVVASNGKPKSKANMTKEERKAEKQREREIEDRRYTLSQAVLKENEEYTRVRKVWMRFLIAGIALMVVALVLYYVVSQKKGDAPVWLSICSMVVMVVAYVVVIAGMVYDWRKVKPVREEVDKRVGSMSDKRVKSALAKRASK